MVSYANADALFREGLEELLYVSPVLGAVARALGRPVWDETQETAYVTFDGDEKSIMFAFNPDFIETLDTDGVAGVIAHETHHVVLNHLTEMTDPIYVDQNALVKAHECIINDTVEGTYMLMLPDFVMRGMTLAGQDCSQLSTYDAYKLFENKKSNPDSTDGNGKESEASDGGASSDSAGAPGEGEPKPGTEASGACGGVQVKPEDMDAMRDAFGDVLKEAADSIGMTEGELADKLFHSTPGGYSPTGEPILDEPALSNERMNWRTLLAKINPKVLEAGKPRRKTRNNWTRYNRRMGAVYPRVILPRSERVEPKKADDNGDKLPVFVIALDLSGSIPRTLVGTLQGLLNDIPEDLIRAYPCTWGTALQPYVKGGRVAGGGTNISLVVNYVNKIKKETGTDPYVLVITDGQFTRHHARPGQEWIWMGVDNASVRLMKGNFRDASGKAEDVHHVRDFQDRG